ncbi:MAG: efflux RND transporter periplasmic adaptor subunit [Planctomycetota bacterium]
MSSPTKSQSAPTNAKGGRARTIIVVVSRIAVCAALLFVGAGVFGVLQATAPEAPRAEIREPTVSVTTVTLEPVIAPRVWEGFGTARAMRSATLTASVSAIVVERPGRIEAGAAVERGELIVRLDDREFTDTADRARAQLDGARADLRGLDAQLESLESQKRLAERSATLLEDEVAKLKDAVARSGAALIEVDRLERELAAAQQAVEQLGEQIELMPSRRERAEAEVERFAADLRRAELDVERTRITSPIDGSIDTIEADLGERIGAGQEVARIVDLSLVEVPVQLPASAIGEVGPGDVVEIQLSDGGSVDGRVARLASQADPLTRTLAVFVEVEQPAESPVIRPGQFVRGHVSSRERPRVVVVPRGAVRADRVIVVETDESGVTRATSRSIETAYAIEAAYDWLHPVEDQWLVVSAGLVGGERVVTNPPNELLTNTRVVATDATAAFGPALATGEPADSVSSEGTGGATQ